jgi:FAD/FMN-containing dehydrogenase
MPPVWLASLQALVDADLCETEPTRLQEYAIDGLIPSVIIRPETAEQVAAVLHWAQREKLAVLPRGSGTAVELGNIGKRLDIVLSTSRLTQISEYDAANFTITAGAGMTCSQVAQVTVANRQLLPLQYPFSAATFGGLVATNTYSPKRLLYGGVRDLLLGRSPTSAARWSKTSRATICANSLSDHSGRSGSLWRQRSNCTPCQSATRPFWPSFHPWSRARQPWLG